MNCNFTEKISLLIDGELPPAELRELESHLLVCAECQQTRADFLNLRTQITGFETVLQPAVQNRSLKRILSRERRTPLPQLPWGFGRAVAFASLLIAATFLGLLLYRNSGPDGSSSKMNASLQTPSPAPSAADEQQPKQAEPKQSPDATRENEPPAPEKNEKESANPPRRAPVKRPIVREPKPGEQFASIPERVRSADAETMTAMHFEKSETLLLAFRNVRLGEPGSTAEVSYERRRAQELVYQNMMLRREADARGDVQIASLLESLEPILLDISNLPDKPDKNAVRVIRERVERKNIVALLRVNSTVLARALD